MKSTKLIQFLKTFSPTELVRFEKYLQSPYFNSHQETTKLFEILKDFYPSFYDKDIDMEKIYKQIYPGTSWTPGKLYTLNNYLLKQVTQFLAWEENGQEYFLQNPIALQRSLMKRSLDKYLDKNLEHTQHMLEEHPYRDAIYHHEKFRLEEFIAEHAINQSNRSHTVSYKQAMESLDQFYLIQKLRYICAIYNQQRILSIQEDIQLLDEVVEYCQTHSLDHIPIAKIYFETLKMLRNEKGEAHFNSLKAYLTKHAQLLPKEELATLYGHLINFCTQKYKSGQAEYLQEMFELYKAMLAFDLLFLSPLIAAIYYKNIVTLSLSLKEIEWAENFIKANRGKIVPAYRETAFNYNMANLQFHKKAYSKSLDYLQRVDFVDAFHRLNYNMLLLKTHYECGDIEALLSLCNAFTTYIRRNKSLSSNNQVAYKNVAKFIRKLVKVKYGSGARSKIKSLKSDLNECQLLVERNWLQEKVNELI